MPNGLDDNRKQFCFFKALDQTENTFGGLHVPTNCFLDYIIKDVLFQKTSIFTKNLTVGKNVMNFNFQKLFLRLCIYNSLKFANLALSNTKKEEQKIFEGNTSLTMCTGQYDVLPKYFT